MNIEMNQRTRIEYFDYLRIFATFAVILIHVSSQHWYDTSVDTFAWQIFNFYENISRWSVPIFFMISGTLLLGTVHDVKNTLRRNIFRFIIAFLFWSSIYATVTSIRDNYSKSAAFFHFIFGHYHLWFVYAITGLYLVVPVLRKIAESDDVIKYFLIMSILFNSLIPQIAHCIGLHSDTGEYILTQMLDQLQLTSITGYAFYFILGYYLNKSDIILKHRKHIYALGILGVVSAIFLSSLSAIWKQEAIHIFYENNTLNVVFASIAVFVFAKYNFSYDRMPRNVVLLIQKLSKYSFGAYLVHVLVLDVLNQYFGLHTLSFNPLISVPAISLIVFCISFFISAIINHIPVLKKYIV